MGAGAFLPSDNSPVSLNPGENLTIVIHYLRKRPGENWAILEIASSSEFVDISLHAPIKSPPLVGVTCRGEMLAASNEHPELIGAYSFGVVPVGALGGARMICDIVNLAQSDNGVLIISGPAIPELPG